jgi:hypothetical protein
MGRVAVVRDFIVGAVFLGSLIAVGFVTIKVTGGVWGQYAMLTVPFDRVNGLKVGDEVRVWGFRIGQVQDIELKPQDRAHPVVVTLRLNRDMDLAPGTKFTVKSAGPLGGSFIEIVMPSEKDKAKAGEKKAAGEDGGRSEPPPGGRGDGKAASRPAETGSAGSGAARSLAGGPRAPRLPDLLGLPIAEAAEKKGAEGEPKVGFYGSAQEPLFDELGELIKENREDIREAIAGLRNAVDALNKQQGTLGALFLDGDLRDRVKDGIANAEAIIRSIQEGKGTIGRLINEPALYDDARDIVARIKVLVADAEAGKGTVGKLLRDDELARDLSDGVGHFAEVLGKINGGVGTAGQIVNNREAWDRLVFVLRQVQEAVEDFREQAPINTFVNAIFAAF